LINVPIGVLTLAATAVLLRESRATASARLDLAGVTLLSTALLLLLYPLIQGPQQEWPAWAFGLMGASLAVLALFVVQQRAQGLRGHTPLVPMRLFSHRGFTGGLVTQLTLFAAVVGFFLVLAIFLQAGLGFSALHAGLTFLPFSLGIALAAGAAGPLAPRLGRRLTTLGSLVMATGMAGLLLAVTLADTQTSTWSLLPGLVIAGVGMGLVAPTLIDVALARVDRDDAGAASGIVTAAGQLGGAIGVALIGVVFFGTLPDPTTTDAARDYLPAFKAALWYEIGVLLLTAALMALLPPSAQRAVTDDAAPTSVL
jgi:predicted MFS family arabinose efflux permease